MYPTNNSKKTGWEGNESSLMDRTDSESRVCLLEVQRLGTHLPAQKTQVQALVQEEPTDPRATKPTRPSY